MGRPRKEPDPNIARPTKRAYKRDKDGKPVEKVKSNIDVSKLPKLYKCTFCGTVRADTAENYFYVIPHATFLSGNDGYSTICTICGNKLYNEYAEMYQSQKFAMLLMCSLMGVYFSERQYESMAQKSDTGVTLGKYIRSLNGAQYKGRTFATYLLELNRENQAFKDPSQMRKLLETNWTAADHRNKNYILQTLGYDCFDDETYTTEDRRFLFNTMSGYMSDEVVEDPHKIQAVINMCKTYLQIAQINVLINSQLKSLQPEMSDVTNMVSTKTKLLHSVNEMAKENAISAIGSGKKAKSTNALTAIMKEMLDNGIDAAKANVVTAKMVDTYRVIAETNARGLVNELQFTGDEYARMVAEQSIIVRDYEQKFMEQDEEIRLLKIKLERAYRDGYAPTGDTIVGRDSEESVDDADNPEGD